MRRSIPAAILAATLFGLGLPAGGAQVADQVTVDGQFVLDRSRHDACFIAVPPVISGPIHLEADFTEGTVSGYVSGGGSGSFTIPAACRRLDPSDYDLTHLETWTAELTIVGGSFAGPLDPESGIFDFEFEIQVTGSGSKSTPGSQYSCPGTSGLASECPLPEAVEVQKARVSGVIVPTGASTGELEWYTTWCAQMTAGESGPEIRYTREGCPTVGSWEATPTNVVWGENTPPKIDSLTASPAEPSSEDEVVVTVEASDPDGDALTYTWFTDGVQESATSSAVTWRKPASGDHVVRVVVSDGRGGEAEAYLDLRVSEHVGAGDRDDDGVPDDEDLCPDEPGLGADGCPDFAAGLGCDPARPIPGEAITCSVEMTGVHSGETLDYQWYLDGAFVDQGSPSWAWGGAKPGSHRVGVDVLGEGRSVSADLAFEVAGGVVDEETAGFRIAALACTGGITSEDTLSCTTQLEREREDVGVLTVGWLIDGIGAHSEATGGNVSTWVLEQPAPGDHRVEVWVTDPVTRFAQTAAAVVGVTPGRNAEIPPILQTGAVAVSVGLAGAWLWLEWMRQQQIQRMTAAAESALATDRQRWYDRVMEMNRLQRERREGLEAAQDAQQRGLGDEFRRLVDGLDEAIDLGADLHAVRDFVDRHEDDVFRDGKWDPAQMARLQNNVRRLGLSQSDRDFFQARVDFMDTVGPTLDFAFEMSRSFWTRLGTGVLTGGFSEALWIPVSSLDTMWQQVLQGRSAEDAASAAYVETIKQTAAMVLWERVLAQGAATFAPEVEGLKDFLKNDFSRWWSVGQVRRLWEGLSEGARLQLTQTADDAWSWLTRERQLPGGQSPQLPVIRHRWGEPVTYLEPEAATPFVRRLNRLRQLGLEDDVVALMSRATRGELTMSNLAGTRFGGQVALSADEAAALRLLQHSGYRPLLSEGAIPGEVHALAVHARDKFVRGQVSAAYERLPQWAKDNLVRIDFTGTGARPHSAAATSGWTDLDLTPRGAPTPEGAAAERLFRTEFQQGLWDSQFNARVADVNMFPGLRPRPLQPPSGGYGGPRLTHWQEVDTSFRGTSAIPTEQGMVFGASPAARPMPGQGPIQTLYRPPVPTGEAVRDAGRLIQGDLSKLEHSLGRPPTVLDILKAEGKHARRVWWANNRGTGQSPPAWMAKLDDLKLHREATPPAEDVREMWEGFTGMFGGNVDFGGMG